jgi:hypothetical protein
MSKARITYLNKDLWTLTSFVALRSRRTPGPEPSEHSFSIVYVCALDRKSPISCREGASESAEAGASYEYFRFVENHWEVPGSSMKTQHSRLDG